MAKLLSDNAIIAVIGLGYVGLPLASAFSKYFQVIGFDIDAKKVRNLTETRGTKTFTFTDKPEEIARADFILICVPTPLTKSKEPDLSILRQAATVVGQNLKKGAVVVLESTVYPGVTEEILVPILDNVSGLKCGRDFRIGYSPERVNPGDDEHTIEKTTKVVSGMDKETTELIAELYGKVATKVFIARDIKTAEAAKAIENIQRDLNIALVNEFAIIFEKMGMNTKDVLDAAGTKWNFHKYSPGLVGGHCIPVVPHYIIYKAKELGYQPQIITAGREINEYMPRYLAELTLKALTGAGKDIKSSKVLIMGLTYKDNLPDAQDSPIWDTISELKKSGVLIFGYDPVLDSADDIFNTKVVRTLADVPKVDAIIISVAHAAFKKIKLKDLKGLMNSSKPVLIDVRQLFDRNEAEREGFDYRAL